MLHCIYTTATSERNKLNEWWHMPFAIAIVGGFCNSSLSTEKKQDHEKPDQQTHPPCTQSFFNGSEKVKCSWTHFWYM